MEENSKKTLTHQELLRYDRQIKIPEFGIEGQEKLKKSSVLIIGCGGLGSPVSMYLAAAGVGTLGLVENDQIDQSNLQRQILYSESDIGESKIVKAADRLKSLNKNIKIKKYSERLSSKNALEIFKDFDVIIDGTDNFPTRYLVNDTCVLLGKPFVSGAIYRFEGQISVYNYQGGVTYRDLFPSPPEKEMAPNCATAGVLGMIAGIVGTIQATEAIKVLTGIGEILSGKLLLIDALSMNFRKVAITKNPEVQEITELIDYEEFCGFDTSLASITYAEFRRLSPEKTQLIDVREKSEFEVENIGGLLLPLSEIEEHIPKIKRDGTVVVHCQSGMRSQRAIELLRDKYGFQNLVNLEGGMNAAKG
ncbi:molybdopterin-synthase adenylyltransferase MoeB [Jiulongibacter sp. NS-SX5]|uniref:molybdopterin-synthase adenylyltransferase MoeB n=1 Tax=Jiulongibacter sp. NS-SX5 TaxID=3463854 RepID=UPI0040583406